MLINIQEAGRKPALSRRGWTGVAFAATMALPTAAHAVDQPIRGYIASSVTAGATAIYALEDTHGESGYGAQPRGVSGSSETPIGNFPHSGTANAAANVTTAHNGSVGASAQATGYGGGAGASSHLVYDIRVIGEDRPEGVPYTISAFGYADSTGQFDQDYGFGHAVATFEIGGLPKPGGGFEVIKVQAWSGFQGAEGYVPINFSQTIMLPTNRDITISLDVLADAGAGTNSQCDLPGVNCATSTTAFLDPYFVIDPAFAADYVLAAPFLLEAPDTTPPGAAVPEPASWAMMIAGFGLTGAAMRRRRSALTA